MKRSILIMMIAVAAAGAVFAQNRESERRRPNLITVEGTLQLHNGFIAVASGEMVYYVPVFHRYTGFIEGLKEGNVITIEGFAQRNFLHPVKAIINGKTYEFPVMGFAHHQRQQPDARHHQRQWHCTAPQCRHSHNGRFEGRQRETTPYNATPPRRRH